MMHPKFRRGEFDRVADSPASWFLTAWKLKRTADEIDWLDDNHQPRQWPTAHDQEKAFLWPVYRMLMGLTFENLLKGLLIAQGRPASTDGRLAKGFKTHDIATLLSYLDASAVPISPEERKVLLDLQDYVVWLGRYPMSRIAEHQDIGTHGSDDHAIEQRLWQRLSDHLASGGWMTDQQGKRILMQLPTGLPKEGEKA
jgi:hypothetical protein